MVTLKWKARGRMGCAATFFPCLLTDRWENLCLSRGEWLHSIQLLGLWLSAKWKKYSVLTWNWGKLEALSPPSTQQANLQCNSLPWIHSFQSSSSQRARKNLRVTVQKRGKVWSLLIPAATRSLSAALNAYVSRVSASVSVLFATAPEAEAPNKPKVCFWVEMPGWDWNYLQYVLGLHFFIYCQPCLYISALTRNFFSFGSYLAQIQTNWSWKFAGSHKLL